MIKFLLLILEGETTTAGVECAVTPSHSSRPQTTSTPLPKPLISLVCRNEGYCLQESGFKEINSGSGGRQLFYNIKAVDIYIYIYIFTAVL